MGFEDRREAREHEGRHGTADSWGARGLLEGCGQTGETERRRGADAKVAGWAQPQHKRFQAKWQTSEQVQAG